MHSDVGILGQFGRVHRFRPASLAGRDRVAAGRSRAGAAGVDPGRAARPGGAAASLSVARGRPQARPEHGRRHVRRTGRRGLADRPAGLGNAGRRTRDSGEDGAGAEAAAGRVPRSGAQSDAGPAGCVVVPPERLVRLDPPRSRGRAERRVRAGGSAGADRVAHRARRLSGPGPRGTGRPGTHRDLRRLLRRATPAVRWRRAARHAGRRGIRAGVPPFPASRRRGPDGAARLRRVRHQNRGSGRAAGRPLGAAHPRPSVPHRWPADPGAPQRRHRLGPRARRRRDRGRLRRRVPLRPGAGGRSSGARSRARALCRLDEQEHLPRPSAGLDGAPRTPGRSGPGGEGSAANAGPASSTSSLSPT